MKATTQSFCIHSASCSRRNPSSHYYGRLECSCSFRSSTPCNLVVNCNFIINSNDLTSSGTGTWATRLLPDLRKDGILCKEHSKLREAKTSKHSPSRCLHRSPSKHRRPLPGATSRSSHTSTLHSWPYQIRTALCESFLMWTWMPFMPSARWSGWEAQRINLWLCSNGIFSIPVFVAKHLLK